MNKNRYHNVPSGMVKEHYMLSLKHNDVVIRNGKKRGSDPKAAA